MTGAFLAAMPAEIDPSAILRIGEEIEAIERELRLRVASQVPLVQTVATHTLDAGGKRLRPALVTLAAAATGRPFDVLRTRKLGACMELIHMATLIHDDVIDGASHRRGLATAANAFGVTESVLCGDVLLAKAMAILAEDGDLDVIRLVSQVVVDLAEGEVLELALRGRLDVTEDEHRQVLRMKTGTFIEACTEVGVHCAGAGPEERAAIRDFGRHIGFAFQIVDDLLDYRNTQVETGKARATDFREGCATLPLIFLMPTLDPDQAELVANRFGNGVTEAEIEQIAQWMVEHGAFGRAQQAAEVHIAEAKSALGALPPTSERLLLDAVADFVLARTG